MNPGYSRRWRGSGSGARSRALDGSTTATAAAADLLTEVTNPGLRDLRIEIEGIRTARSYPEDLPNLAEGSQQVVVGRFLPDPGQRQGTITLTGMRGDKEVRFEAPVEIPEIAEGETMAGNSFIPRLWARGHLDASSPRAAPRRSASRSSGSARNTTS